MDTSWDQLNENPPNQQISNVDWNDLSDSPQEAKYGGIGQQLIAGAEALGRGIAGPLATAAEVGLGVNPQDIKGRQEANPFTSTAGEITGLVGGAFIPVVGEASLGAQAARLGEAAVGAAKLGEAASTVSKIAATGVKASAEMAALQTSDEISKAIIDPQQSLGSAAVNVGLSGLMGLAGGAALGTVGQAWKTAANKIGVEKLANDFMGETKFLNENPDLGAGAAEEVNNRLAEADQLIGGGLKTQAIEKALPEATPDNIQKIDQQLNQISNEAEKRIQNASDNAYLRGAAPKLQQDLNDFQSVITDPNSNLSDKWNALDDYKRASQQHADYNTLTGGTEEKALSKWIKPFNASLRESLEDSKVWGKAGDVQKNVNEALSDLFQAQKDFLPKVTSKELGERVADPGKLQTLVNQAQKGKAVLKQNAVRNYLDATQAASDAINKAHLDVGLEAPLESKLNPTPVLEHVLNTEPTVGVNLARTIKAKGAQVISRASGEAAAGAVGGLGGSLVGHPLVGAYLAEKILGPALGALAKPFAEKAINAEAMKSSVDFAKEVARSQFTIKNTVKDLFKNTAEVLPRELLPKKESIDTLKDNLNEASNNPQGLMDVGGNIGHYLPDHKTAVAALAATARDYFNSIKPQTIQNSPLDMPSPPNPIQEQKYNRALNIAEQPLMVLKHINDGRLENEDVTTLSTLYPGLHKQLVSEIQNEIIEFTAKDITIPYYKRVGMSKLIGMPLDSTMSVGGMQAIMNSSVARSEVNESAQKHTKGATQAQLKQMDKVNSLYPTRLQNLDIKSKA